MSAQLPPSIEAEAEDLAHGTELTTREAVVLLCDRDGLANESIRAYLGAMDDARAVTVNEIGRILGWSNSRVEDTRASIREKKRELEDQKKRIDRTLAVIEGEDE